MNSRTNPHISLEFEKKLDEYNHLLKDAVDYINTLEKELVRKKYHDIKIPQDPKAQINNIDLILKYLLFVKNEKINEKLAPIAIVDLLYSIYTFTVANCDNPMDAFFIRISIIIDGNTNDLDKDLIERALLDCENVMKHFKDIGEFYARILPFMMMLDLIDIIAEEINCPKLNIDSKRRDTIMEQLSLALKKELGSE